MNGHVTVAICIRGVLGFVVGVVWDGSRSIYPSRFLHVDHLHPVQPKAQCYWLAPYSRAESLPVLCNDRWYRTEPPAVSRILRRAGSQDPKDHRNTDKKDHPRWETRPKHIHHITRLNRSIEDKQNESGEDGSCTCKVGVRMHAGIGEGLA